MKRIVQIPRRMYNESMTQVITNKEHKKIYSKFRDDLVYWASSKTEPKTGNHDIQYFLELQQERWKDHHISCKYTFAPEGHIYRASKISNSIPYKDRIKKYNQYIYHQQINRTISYYQNGQELDSKKEFVGLYETFIDVNTKDKEIEFECPNCGGLSPLHVLEEDGCPFCGTKYDLEELHTKVTNFFYLQDGSFSDQQWFGYKKWILTISLALTVFFMLFHLHHSIFVLILMFFFSFLFFLALVLLAGFILYIRQIHQATDEFTQLMEECKGTKKQVSLKLAQYDPSFTYEYFESKAMALARIVLFHNDPDHCLQYEGSRIGDAFFDILDVKYKGGFILNSVRLRQNVVHVNLTLLVTTTTMKDSNIIDQDERITLEMIHNIHFPVDASHSIIKMQCEHCGGSFDARKSNTCPYCGSSYDLESTDWKLIKIYRNE